MDTIFIHKLRIDTIIGIYDWERTNPQTVYLDIEMGVNIRPAASSDHIDDTPDYKAVAERLLDFVGESAFFLLEAMAENIADLVLAEFAVQRVKVTIHKPGALDEAEDAGVMIERQAP